jgi:hypothetical protein
VSSTGSAALRFPRAPGFIPLHLLPLIGVSEDRVSIHGPEAFAVPSIFDRLREEGGSYRFLMFPDLFGDDEAVFSATLASVSEGHDLYLLQFSDSDALCHLHGSEGEVRRRVTRELDRKVSVVAEAFENAYAQPSFMVIGDHGMMDVDTTVDVATVVHGRAAAAGLRHGYDYLLFLDSTLARLWSLNDRARRAARRTFSCRRPDMRRPIDGGGGRYRIPPPARATASTSGGLIRASLTTDHFTPPAGGEGDARLRLAPREDDGSL